MDAATALHELLGDAKAAFAAGDAQAVERRAKAICALVRAELAVAELRARTPPPEEDEEALRAELRRRLDRFLEADLEGAPDEALEQILDEEVHQ